MQSDFSGVNPPPPPHPVPTIPRMQLNSANSLVVWTFGFVVPTEATVLYCNPTMGGELQSSGQLTFFPNSRIVSFPPNV